MEALFKTLDSSDQTLWEEYIKNELKDADSLSKLNDALQTRVFLGKANRLSQSDLSLYQAVHPIIENMSTNQRLLKSNVTRWFDNVQHLEEFSSDRKLPIIHINRNATTLSDKPEKPQAEKKQKTEKIKQEKPVSIESKPEKEEKKVEAQKTENNGASKNQDQQQRPKKEPKQQQQQQQKGGGKGGKRGKQASDDPEQPDITHLDIRVGKIVHVEKHPNADTLYVEQIDLGESAPRTIVSGLVNFVPIDEMKDRLVVVLCNLKPKPTRGVTSHGMVLCASIGSHDDPTNGKVEPLDPPADSIPGTLIHFDGFTGFKPDDELNPKKKYFEKVQPDFITTSERIAAYKDKPFLTPTGPCIVKSIVGGSIK